MKSKFVFLGLAAVLACAAAVHAANRPQEAPWNVVAEATLVRIGEPARVDNPACSSGSPTTAAIVREKIYNTIDSYIGYPVLNAATSASPDASNWLNERFGLNDGRSSCAVICAIVPVRVPVKVCEEDAMFGRACFMPGDTGDGPQPYSWTGPLTRATSQSGRADVVCANQIKNWSDNLDRRFTLEADY